MHAMLRIGDMTITVVEAHLPDNKESHVIQVTDTFKIEGGLESKKLLVNKEYEACLILASALEPDEPGDRFRQHFPEFCS